MYTPGTVRKALASTGEFPVVGKVICNLLDQQEQVLGPAGSIASSWNCPYMKWSNGAGRMAQWQNS